MLLFCLLTDTIKKREKKHLSKAANVIVKNVFKTFFESGFKAPRNEASRLTGVPKSIVSRICVTHEENFAKKDSAAEVWHCKESNLRNVQE